MSFNSAIYVGAVMHRRVYPRRHRFRYRAFWCLFDLEELPKLQSGLRFFSHNRWNLFSLRDSDHGNGSATPLYTQAERLLTEAGIVAGGPIQLLCMPRTFGYCFNPLSIYYCHAPDGSLAALIYQVHNTFGERHSYVIPARNESGEARQNCRKRFYVSPFLGMDMRYDFRIAVPDDRIAVGIRASSAAAPVLHAVLSGERRALTDFGLFRLAIMMPAITLKVMVAIHWEAIRLWVKGLRLHARPQNTAGVAIAAAPATSRPE